MTDEASRRKQAEAAAKHREVILGHVKRGLIAGAIAGAVSYFMDDGSQIALIGGFTLPASVAVGGTVAISSVAADLLITETPVAQNEYVAKLGTYLVPVFTGTVTAGVGVVAGLTPYDNLTGLGYLFAAGGISRVLAERVEIMLENKSTIGPKDPVAKVDVAGPRL